MARNATLARSRDTTSCTLVWDCTAGSFDWFYNVDETIYVLEGSVVLSQDRGPARRIGPGDVVFFPAGSSARWQVESYVRKLAFFRRALPKPFEKAILAARALRRLVRPSRSAAAGWAGMPVTPN